MLFRSVIMKSADINSKAQNDKIINKKNSIDIVNYKIKVNNKSESASNSDSENNDSICEEYKGEENFTTIAFLQRSFERSRFSFKSGTFLKKISNKNFLKSKSDYGEKKSNILIVDDIPINRLVLSGMLKSLGYEFKEAFNGKEACDLILSTNIKFDIVFMDIQMPIMNGIEAAKNIRKFYNSKSLPIIGVTALSSELELSHCISVGMNNVIIKPLSLDDLKKVLAKYDLWNDEINIVSIT